MVKLGGGTRGGIGISPVGVVVVEEEEPEEDWIVEAVEEEEAEVDEDGGGGDEVLLERTGVVAVDIYNLFLFVSK